MPALSALHRIAVLLDEALRVPGTRRRIGLDPLIGLIPGIGDLITPAFAVVLLVHAGRMGVPRVVQLRMVINVAIDALLGTVPVVGDLFDFAWKANLRNVRLLEAHAGSRTSVAGDWLFVLAVVALLVLVAALPVVLVWLALGALLGIGA
ncbi:MAG: DUF4112 domain-containing protein [Acidimicrobiia bacterium]|nr:DUF4112 domain-containing protein [Acidimicrobiia bacterium]